MSEQTKPKYGPKMAALPNDRWRAFVIHLLDLGGKGHGHSSAGKGYTGAARMAGFQGSPTAMSVKGHQLAHDTRIQEALQEEARKRLALGVPDALVALSEITRDKSHKDRLGAVKTTLDRAGLHEVQEKVVKHEFIGDSPEMLEQVRQLALRLKIPLQQLLGKSLAPDIKDAEFVALPRPTEGEKDEDN